VTTNHQESLIDYSGYQVDTDPVIRHHERGGPDCSEVCDASQDRHRGDPPKGWPEVCQGCGGSGYQCYPRCLYGARGSAYEPWEGRTGAQEAWDDDESGVRGMPWVTG
jgi:hypothetical protein